MLNAAADGYELVLGVSKNVVESCGRVGGGKNKEGVSFFRA